MSIEVFAPDGAIGPQPAALAPSPSVLSGLRIGILDNTKPNAGLLLGRIAESLAERTGAVVAHTETKNAALAAPEQVMGRLTEEMVQVVLTGTAD